MSESNTSSLWKKWIIWISEAQLVATCVVKSAKNSILINVIEGQRKKDIFSLTLNYSASPPQTNKNLHRFLESYQITKEPSQTTLRQAQLLYFFSIFF